MSDIKQDLIGLYRDNTEVLAACSGDILNHPREKALLDFDRLGIPTTKNESYRYTPLDKYFDGFFDVELRANPFQVDLHEIFKCDVPELETMVVLVLNGFYYGVSREGSLPGGVIVCGLNEAATRYPEKLLPHYSRYADTAADGIVALNTLFSQDGVFVYIPDGVTVEQPIQIINISHAFRNLRLTRRNLIVAGAGSHADVVVCDHTLCSHAFLTNSLTEVVVGPGASLNYNRLQNENSASTHISNLFIHQEANSRFTGNTVSLHGGLIRNNFQATLNGPSCESNLFGLFLCDDNQHVANYVLMDHAAPHCHSNQLFKGILDDNATGAFNGKILVRKDAQKTEAYQKNNNILLSSSARMNTKPHLEIYADDVKCSHGATVGQLDTEAMFYLRSRGIGQKEARHLLMYAFANDIVGNISVPVLKDRIIALVDKRLRGELARCANCDIHCG